VTQHIRARVKGSRKAEYWPEYDNTDNKAILKAVTVQSKKIAAMNEAISEITGKYIVLCELIDGLAEQLLELTPKE